MNKRLTMVLKMGRGLMWTLDILVRAEIHFLDTFCWFLFYLFFSQPFSHVQAAGAHSVG